MKNIIKALLTGIIGVLLTIGLDAWYQTVPWYMTNEQIYMLIVSCIAIANLVVEFVVNRIKFKKKVETTPVNWISVDED